MADNPREKLMAVNASLSEINETLQRHASKLNDLLQTIANNPSGWVLRIQKQGGNHVEIPMTKELAVMVKEGAFAEPVFGLPPGASTGIGPCRGISSDCACIGCRVVDDTPVGYYICYAV